MSCLRLAPPALLGKELEATRAGVPAAPGPMGSMARGKLQRKGQRIRRACSIKLSSQSAHCLLTSTNKGNDPNPLQNITQLAVAALAWAADFNLY